MRRLALTGALLMLCTNTAAGCRQQEKQEVTPEVLMDAVDKNMKEVNSASSSLEIEVELEDVLDHTRIRMDMDMENTVSPRVKTAPLPVVQKQIFSRVQERKSKILRLQSSR